MSLIQRTRPADDASLRRALYEGTVFLLPPKPASLALVELARRKLVDEVGDDPRHAHERIGDAELFTRLGDVRRALYLDPEARRLTRELAAEVGFEASATAFDPVRLRIVMHRGIENPRAAPVYFPHRDTWYAHPSSTVTMWTALDDLRAEETFVFYPERFQRPVANDSEAFDYAERGAGLKIGWQDRNASSTARYSGALGEEDYGPSEGFSCRRGEVLLFSGAHLHRTLPQAVGTTRFSLDVRLVQLGDHAAGLGAPNVDNRSRGSALVDYVQPGP